MDKDRFRKDMGDAAKDFLQRRLGDDPGFLNLPSDNFNFDKNQKRLLESIAGDIEHIEQKVIEIKNYRDFFHGEESLDLE